MLQELVELRSLGFIQELKQPKKPTPKPKYRPSSSKHTPTLALIDEDEEMIYSSGEEDKEKGEWKIDDGDDIDDDFFYLDLDADT